MRAELHLILPSGSAARLKEITPFVMAQALVQLLDSGDRSIKDVSTTDWDNALLSHSDLIHTKGNIAEADNLLISEQFTALNHAFYHQANQNKRNSTLLDNRKLSVLHKDLNHTCASLIQLGHRDVWQYGWFLYTVAQEINQKKD
jgi:hypothetical protein